MRKNKPINLSQQLMYKQQIIKLNKLQVTRFMNAPRHRYLTEFFCSAIATASR